MTNTADDVFTMENLYLAYRKAKIDIFHERSQPMAEAFCEFEESLHDNLSNLAAKLRTDDASDVSWSRDLNLIGGFGYHPGNYDRHIVPAAY